MRNQQQTKQKLLIVLGMLVILALLLLFVFSGSNFDLLKSIFLDDLSNEELRETLSGFGWRGYITVVMLSMLQVRSYLWFSHRSFMLLRWHCHGKHCHLPAL